MTQGAPLPETQGAGATAALTEAPKIPRLLPTRASRAPVSADSGLYGAESPASGTITGPNVSATFCNAGASVFVQSYASYPTMTYLQLSHGNFQFANPTTASDAFVTGVAQIAAAAPGTYTSSDPTNCGNVGVSYALPVPVGVDCGDGGLVGPSCPPGCTSACSGLGCEPCAPNQPEGSYFAAGGGTCFDESVTAVGSWTITLDSVERYTGDAGAAQGRVNYVAHGSLSAQLVGGVDDSDAGNEPATLTMTF